MGMKKEILDIMLFVVGEASVEASVEFCSFSTQFSSVINEIV